MNMDDYRHLFLAEDGRLCSMGHHFPGFPRVLYDALLRLGYNGDVPIYCYRLSMVDGLDICKTCVTIPLNLRSCGWEPSLVASPTLLLSRQHTSHSPPCVRATLRPCPTSGAPISMPTWLRWPSTRSTCSTCSTTPPEHLCSNVCV
jgi:hypothetical protein